MEIFKKPMRRRGLISLTQTRNECFSLKIGHLLRKGFISPLGGVFSVLGGILRSLPVLGPLNSFKKGLSGFAYIKGLRSVRN